MLPIGRRWSSQLRPRWPRCDQIWPNVIKWQLYCLTDYSRKSCFLLSIFQAGIRNNKSSIFIYFRIEFSRSKVTNFKKWKSQSVHEVTCFNFRKFNSNPLSMNADFKSHKVCFWRSLGRSRRVKKTLNNWDSDGQNRQLAGPISRVLIKL